MTAGLAALTAFIAVAALVMGLSGRRGEAQASVDRRLGRAKGLESGPSDMVSGSALRGSRFGKNTSMARTLGGIQSMQAVGTSLERAGWRLSVTEFLAVSGAAGIISFFIATMFLPAIAVIGGIVGLFVPDLMLRFAAKKRRDTFVKQLVDALTLIANALKAGVSLMQAIDNAQSQLKPPIADEFRRLLLDIRIGSTPDDAFQAMADRIHSEDLDIVITGIIVQRSTGGNLAEMLESVAHVMRERLRIKGEIKTLTAQQQMSGYLVGSLPILLLLAFNAMNHAYVLPLFTTTPGHVMLAAGATLQIIGFLMIRKIVNIKV